MQTLIILIPDAEYNKLGDFIFHKISQIECYRCASESFFNELIDIASSLKDFNPQLSFKKFPKEVFK